VLVHVFNHAVEYLRAMLTRPELAKMSWPPPEFRGEDGPPPYWNEPAYWEAIMVAVDGLRLPEPTDFKTFLTTIGLNGHRFEATAKRRGCVPWTDLMSAGVDCRLRSMNAADPYDQNGREMVVGFFRDDVEDFRLPERWRTDMEPALDDLPKVEEKPAREKHIPASRSVSSHVELADELNSSLRFEEKLKRALEESDDEVKVKVRRGSAEDISYKYLPSAAVLSPSVAALASPLSAHLRLRSSFDGQRQQGGKRSLPVLAEDDLEASRILDEKLRRALS